MNKHFDLIITDTSLTAARKTEKIDAEAAFDGIYVLRTCVPAADLDAAAVITGYKNLAHLERDFRIIRADDLDLRPIFHRLEDRVRAHAIGPTWGQRAGSLVQRVQSDPDSPV